MKIILLTILLVSKMAFSKELSVDEFIYGETSSQNNPMLMKTKPKKIKKKIDRSIGFFEDKDSLIVTDLDDDLVDSTMEEKEISKAIKEIISSLKEDEATDEKLIKVQDDIKLDNESLEDVESRYQKLLKVNSTPKEPSDTEEAEISSY